MACSSNCCGTADFFGERIARQHLRKYRRRGPFGTTKRLLAALRAVAAPKQSLLDVGGGVGMIAHEMLAAGTTSAVIVDASPAFLAAARDESERRHTEDRLRLQLGDAVELRDDVPAADVVTLDKVVCCYVDMESLLAITASRARRLMALAYPRDDWWVRAMVAGGNLMLRLRGSTFRSYVHSNAAIVSALGRAGLVRRSLTRGPFWIVAVFERTATT